MDAAVRSAFCEERIGVESQLFVRDARTCSRANFSALFVDVEEFELEYVNVLGSVTIISQCLNEQFLMHRSSR